MDLAGKDLVVWLSPEAIETVLGVLEPSQEHVMTTWTVAGQIVGKGPGRGAGEARAPAQRRRDAAPRGAGLLPPTGARHGGAPVRRAAGGRAAAAWTEKKTDDGFDSVVDVLDLIRGDVHDVKIALAPLTRPLAELEESVRYLDKRVSRLEKAGQKA